jgi:hypothetical protein
MGIDIRTDTRLSEESAKRELNLDHALLDRIASVYEELFGPIPRNELGERVFAPEVIVRLSSARRLVEVGFETSLRAALAASAAPFADSLTSPAAAATDRISSMSYG